ncbi:MAG: helix-turn-helix transcriptional regulator [Clostridia bacterium]|nr:helix-turn-helix transcriptional regulator [Clostridia bacterium]
MSQGNFVITDFVSLFVAHDRVGVKRVFEKRYATAFIITKKGAVRFSFDGGEVVSDASHAVMIPEGLTYTNECLSDAESYVFNFHTLGVHEPMQFDFSAHEAADRIYSEMLEYSFSPSMQNGCAIMERMYSLAKNLFGSEEKSAGAHPIISDAIRFMQMNLATQDLAIKDVARSCNISEIYLRKLFERYVFTTPYKKLTAIRMARARLLIKEKRSIKEVSLAVGYSDLFQFSRAYKRYYGYPPSCENER